MFLPRLVRATALVAALLAPAALRAEHAPLSLEELLFQDANLGSDNDAPRLRVKSTIEDEEDEEDV